MIQIRSRLKRAGFLLLIKSEEMLSSQMLSGIPEVDLGIDEKIRNIEATDAAKRKAAEERLRKAKSGAPSKFVPSNLAVNFKHHNRFKPEIEERLIIDSEKALASAGNKTTKSQGNQKRSNQKDEQKFITEKTVNVGQLPEERIIAVSGGSGATVKENDPTRATDDLHVTKFKKTFSKEVAFDSSSQKLINENCKLSLMVYFVTRKWLCIVLYSLPKFPGVGKFYHGVPINI